ncbi:MAG: hypothetical protein B0A82_09935 [Alkalinema sp. CACIAM 70d]|nr:MAG: hypothetical protein B0A82_09935 [Alkalinema sp. CACIAM 70d]
MKGQIAGFGILIAIAGSLGVAPMARADWAGQIYFDGDQRIVEQSRTIIINGQNSEPTVIYEKSQQLQPGRWGGTATYYSHGNYHRSRDNWPQHRFPVSTPFPSYPSVSYPSVGQPIVINNPQNVYIAPRRYSGYNFRTRICTTSFEGIRTCND